MWIFDFIKRKEGLHELGFQDSNFLVNTDDNNFDWSPVGHLFQQFRPREEEMRRNWNHPGWVCKLLTDWVKKSRRIIAVRRKWLPAFRTTLTRVTIDISITQTSLNLHSVKIQIAIWWLWSDKRGRICSISSVLTSAWGDNDGNWFVRFGRIFRSISKASLTCTSRGGWTVVILRKIGIAEIRQSWYMQWWRHRFPALGEFSASIPPWQGTS